MIGRTFLNIVSLVLLSTLFSPFFCHAEDIFTASPSWVGFTSPDERGLYHDLIHAVFDPRGDRVLHMEVPAKRGLVMVRDGQADIYMCRPAAEEGLQLAAAPMYEGEFHALFRSDAFPHWDGPRSMANLRVVWRLGYYTPRELPVPVQYSETTTGVEALNRLVRGGADFYIDDRHLIMESMHAYPTPLDEKAYRIESVGFRQYFPAFAKTERGDRLRNTFEEGMKSLARQGSLKAIYEKWRLPMPRAFQ